MIYGQVFNLMPRKPRKITGTDFSQKLIRPQGHSAAGRITSFENVITSSGMEPAIFGL
jgi:hypothetical protein